MHNKYQTPSSRNFLILFKVNAYKRKGKKGYFVYSNLAHYIPQIQIPLQYEAHFFPVEISSPIDKKMR